MKLLGTSVCAKVTPGALGFFLFVFCLFFPGVCAYWQLCFSLRGLAQTLRALIEPVYLVERGSDEYSHQLKMLLREIVLLSTLHHPNVLQLIGLLTSDAGEARLRFIDGLLFAEGLEVLACSLQLGVMLPVPL